jgi:UDP-N-acetylmuramoyl-L-alanyl-D-glutamate--2,6-diaminopimelate ligase
MKLSRLMEGIAMESNFPGEVDPEIGSVHYRSQDVRPGGLFVAIPGLKADGHDYI